MQQDLFEFENHTADLAFLRSILIYGVLTWYSASILVLQLCEFLPMPNNLGIEEPHKSSQRRTGLPTSLISDRNVNGPTAYPWKNGGPLVTLNESKATTG